MFDDEFEQTRDYLKTKLGDYLRSRGINPAAEFRCLNPEHRDLHPSMSYNMHNHTVHCFACNATYDIFDLVGMDCQLLTFREQLARLHEMFLSHSLTRLRPFEQPGGVTFGISNDNSLQRAAATRQPLPSPAAPGGRTGERTALPSLNDESLRAAAVPVLGTAAPLQRAQGVRFGQESPGFGAPSERSEGLAERRVSFAAYLKQCRSQVSATDFFTRLGISREVVERFGLGYDESYEAAYDHASGESMLWQAAIIPSSEYSYLACNADLYSKERPQRRGRPELFNAAALGRPGAVFITGSELDALALESLGSNALAVTGTQALRQLLELLAADGGGPRHDFYLCLPAGEGSAGLGGQLSAGLRQLQLSCRQINIAFPYRDPGEALLRDREGLLYRLQHLERILAHSLQPLLAPRAERYILEGGQLLELALSPSLYAICGQAALLRTLCAALIRQMRAHLVYAGSTGQWQLLCNCLEDAAAVPQQPYVPPAYQAELLEIRAGWDVREFSAAIEASLASCRIQQEGGFILVADLLAAAEQQLMQCALFLGCLSQSYQQAVIILAHEKFQELLEGSCMQVLSLSRDGQELRFTTCGRGGREADFVLSGLLS